MRSIITLPNDWEERIERMSDSEIAEYLYGICREGTSIEDRPRGDWKRTKLGVSSGDFCGGYKCSKCSYEVISNDFNYCPNCGCRMMGKEQE